MRKLLAAVALALGVAAVTGSAAATSGAHYMNATGASVNSAGGLVIHIDEAGVGNETVDYSLVIHVVADWGCINGGGNHPQASNKETVTDDATVSFSEEPRNGRVRADFTVPAPDPGDFDCPGGQTLVLADVDYDATLIDVTNGPEVDLSAARVFFTFVKH